MEDEKYNEILNASIQAYKDAIKSPHLQFTVRADNGDLEIDTCYQTAGSNWWTPGTTTIISFCFQGADDYADPSEDEIIENMNLSSNIIEQFNDEKEEWGSTFLEFLHDSHKNLISEYESVFEELKQINIEYLADEIVEGELDDRFEQLLDIAKYDDEQAQMHAEFLAWQEEQEALVC